jgi:hypothetical protein
MTSSLDARLEILKDGFSVPVPVTDTAPSHSFPPEQEQEQPKMDVSLGNCELANGKSRQEV